MKPRLLQVGLFTHTQFRDRKGVVYRVMIVGSEAHCTAHKGTPDEYTMIISLAELQLKLERGDWTQEIAPRE